MIGILRQLALWVGVTLFRAGCSALLDKGQSGKALLAEIADAVDFAERVGEKNRLEGEAKMKLALEQLKKSSIKEIKTATESGLRALVEMKLNKLL